MTAHDSAAASRQQLTFALAGEEYGVDILAVREIRGWSRVTPIPGAPPFVLGVLNLRGAMVPVIDLRSRFGLERVPHEGTVTIVVAIGTRLFGIVVDAVSDVHDADPGAVKPVPDMGAVVDMRYLKGLVGNGERMILLLDVEGLLRPEDARAIEEALAAPDVIANAAS